MLAHLLITILRCRPVHQVKRQARGEDEFFERLAGTPAFRQDRGAVEDAAHVRFARVLFDGLAGLGPGHRRWPHSWQEVFPPRHEEFLVG